MITFITNEEKKSGIITSHYIIHLSGDVESTADIVGDKSS
jgi:hypothetical protein